MAMNYKKFFEGIRIVPKSADNTSEQGDLDVSSANGKIYYNDGVISSPLVTEAGTATLTNKTINGNNNTLLNIPGSQIIGPVDAAAIADGSVSNTEFETLDGVTSNIQTQINGKADVNLGNLSNPTAINRTLQAAATNTFNLGTAAVYWQQLFAHLLKQDNSTAYVELGSSSGLRDSSGAQSVDWANRQLANGASVKVDWSGTDPSLNSHKLTNVNDPTLITDAATKNYVDQTTTPAVIAVKGDLIVGNNAGLPVRLGVGADGQTLVADSNNGNGVKWAQLNGIKNYISNSGAESSLSGWVTYANTPGPLPIDGTGGSPTLLLSRVLSPALRGIASFGISHSAANHQGEGVSCDFTIDLADQAQPLSISFDYTIFTGTYLGAPPSDLQVFIYDVTNGVLIEPSNIQLDGSVIAQNYRYNASFQASPNSLSYRLIIHCATTNASAYQFLFDDVVVGPSANADLAQVTAVGVGGIPTSSISGTPTAFVLPTIFVDTNGSYNSSTGEITIPSAGIYVFSINVAIQATFSANNSVVMEINKNGSDAFSFIQRVESGNFHLGNATTPPITCQAGDVMQWLVNTDGATPGFYAATDSHSMGMFKIGGSSGSGDGQVVGMFAGGPSNSITGGGGAMTTFTDVRLDNTASFNASTGIFTAPSSGLYYINANVLLSATYIANNYIQLVIQVNGSNFAGNQNRTGAGVNNQGCWVSTIAQLNAGDQVVVNIASDGSGAAYTAGSTFNYFNVAKLAINSAEVGANEFIGIKYFNASATAITTSNQSIQFADNKDYDSHNAWSGNIFTAPAAGKYHFSVHLTTAGTILSTGDNWNMYAYKNGSTIVCATYIAGTGASNTYASRQLNSDVQLNAGDTLQFNSQTAIATIALDASQGSCSVAIHRIN